MTSFERLLSDSEIERTACELLGVVAARVFRWQPRKDPWESEAPPAELGLYVKGHDGAEWSLLALRRSKLDLLRFVETRAAAEGVYRPPALACRSMHERKSVKGNREYEQRPGEANRSFEDCTHAKE